MCFFPYEYRKILEMFLSEYALFGMHGSTLLPYVYSLGACMALPYFPMCIAWLHAGSFLSEHASVGIYDRDVLPYVYRLGTSRLGLIIDTHTHTLTPWPRRVTISSVLYGCNHL